MSKKNGTGKIHIPEMRIDRMGRFVLQDHFMRSDRLLVGKILKELEFIPVHVEHRMDMDAFIMAGYSPLFDTTKIGMMIPEYDLVVAVDTEDEFKLQINRRGSKQ